MKFLLPVALLASAVAAQTSSCAAENILQTCLETTTAVFNACGPNDWECKCYGQQAIVTYVSVPPPPFAPLAGPGRG